MSLWGLCEVPQKIEFISYTPKYREQTLDVIRKSFFQFETVSVGSEINKNVDAQKDLELLCEDVLERSAVSIIARDVEKDLVVGAALNVVQEKTPSSDEPSYFETFRDHHCKTNNAKSLMNYMIVADSKVDIFDHFKVNSLLEIMFLAVLKEYQGKRIAYNLCKYSIDLGENLKKGKDVEKYLSPGQQPPQLVSALWTGRGSQGIGAKLGFEVIFKDSFNTFSFNGKTFAERAGDPSLEYHVAAKQI